MSQTLNSTAPREATWTSSTNQNTSIASLAFGYSSALVTCQVTGTISGGVIVFEGFDGINWYPISANEALGGATDQNYTLTGGNMAWFVNIIAFTQFRVRLSTVVSGTGSVFININSSQASLPNPGGSGSSGTQYLDGGAAPTHPLGNALEFVNGSGNWQTVGATAGLPVSVVGSGDQNVNLNEVGGASFALGSTTASASIPVVIASNQVVPISNPLVTTPLVGQAKIATTGTAVQLSTQTLSNGVIISANGANATPISIGGSGVNNTVGGTGNGYLLAAGASISFAMANVNDLYINGTAGDYVSWAGS